MWKVYEKITVCGNYENNSMYQLHASPIWNSGRHRKTGNPTRPAQQRVNKRNAELKFTQLLHCNFNSKDYIVHLTFANEPKDENEVKRLVKNYQQTIRYHRNKANLPENKNLYVIEHSNYGNGRLHVHIVISGGLTMKLMTKLWKHGMCEVKYLEFDENSGLAKLAQYLCKKKTLYKRWIPSRNLDKPQTTIKEIDFIELKNAVKAIIYGNWQKHFEDRQPGWLLGGKPIIYANFKTSAISIYYNMHRMKSERLAKGMFSVGKTKILRANSFKLNLKALYIEYDGEVDKYFGDNYAC